MQRHSLIGTRSFVLNVIGDFSTENVSVQVNKEHKLPNEIQNQVSSRWLETLNKKIYDSVSKGAKREEIKIDESTKPMPELKILDNGEWKRTMFAGPLMRIDDFDIVNGNFEIQGSPTHYAAMMATQNYDPIGILDKYGMNGLANSAALSVTPTFQGKDGEVIQIFERTKTLGEYPEYLGTAAGNVSSISEDAVIKTALTELYEESGVVPKVEFLNDLKERGIVRKDAEIDLYNFPSGLEGVKVTRRGVERKAVFYEGLPRCVGLMMNIDVDEKDSKGNTKPHFKHEFMNYLHTGIPLEDYDSLELWRTEEHSDRQYIPATFEDAKKFALDTFVGKPRAMPPATGVIAYSSLKEGGMDSLIKIIDAINEKYPIGSDHPFYTRLNDGRLEKAGYKVETLIQI